MTSDELIEIVAKAAFDAFYADGTPYTDIERAMFAQVATTVIAALRVAGVIPAEGTVFVNAKQWEDTSDMADALCQWVDGIRYYKREAAAETLTTGGMLSWDDLSYAVDEFRAEYVGDLDAVPARAGEGAE